MANRYQIEKEKAREKAIDWQNDFANHSWSYSELAEWAAYFERLGKRYGLLNEFRAEGIL